MNDHALANLAVARGDQRVLSLDLNHADAARADLVEIPEIAERGNFYAGRARGLENAGSLRRADAFSVYRQRYHLSIRPPLKIP